MIRQYSILFIFLFFLTPVFTQYISSVTQPDKSKPVIKGGFDLAYSFASRIAAEDLKSHLTMLASDKFEGRETGTKGNVEASNYISTFFARLSLGKPNGINEYKQMVEFTFSSWDDTDIFANGKRFRHLWDFIAFPAMNSDMPLLESKEVIFLGYGIDDPKYSDYKGKTFKNKIIIINSGEPVKADGTYWISGTTSPSDWSGDISKKLKLAKEKGVSLVLIIDEDIKKNLANNRNKLLGPSVELGDRSQQSMSLANSVYISTSIAKEIFGKEEAKIMKARQNILNNGKFKAIKLKCPFQINLKKSQSIVKSQNVAAVIEGSTKPEEVVVISAHYDHLGKKGDQIYYGADDNGSGTSTVMALAKAFSEARDAGLRTHRTLLFILFTGEEKGLLGSEYYVNHPIYPLKNTVANVNIDMVGRVDEKYKDNPNYIYVIGSDRLSSDLHKINEEVNQKYTQLVLDYTYNAEDDPNKYYFRSDHYNFASKGIPSIFYFNGVHADYHQPTDTVEKINFDKMAEVAKLIFYNIWEVANRPERLKVDVVQK